MLVTKRIKYPFSCRVIELPTYHHWKLPNTKNFCNPKRREKWKRNPLNWNRTGSTPVAMYLNYHNPFWVRTHVGFCVAKRSQSICLPSDFSHLYKAFFSLVVVLFVCAFSCFSHAKKKNVECVCDRFRSATVVIRCEWLQILSIAGERLIFSQLKHFPLCRTHARRHTVDAHKESESLLFLFLTSPFSLNDRNAMCLLLW